VTELSLGEAEALARKAARGAGFDWGMAEEAGRALRWLCARGLPGGAALAALLSARDGDVLSGACPLATGTALADRALPDCKFDAVASPLLLLPFAAQVAALAGRPVRLAWPGAQVDLAPDGTACLGDGAALDAPRAAPVTLQQVARGEGRLLARGTRAALDDATCAVLDGFAARTYAPATPESRLAGAGAGLTDND
jgi:hypothetical protein